MAGSKDPKAPKGSSGLPKGVRGPGGPNAGASTNRQPDRPMMGAQSPSPSAGRRSLEQWSYPLLTTLHRMPRWLIVVLPAILLFFGLILTGSLAWLGGILLFLVWLFVAWLTALSWPALSPGSRIFRTLVVLALLGIVVLKFMGRF